mgnify:FL=1
MYKRQLQYTEHEKSAASITRLSCTLIPVAGCDDRGGGRINGLWEVAETDRLRVTNSSAAASLNSGADLQIDTQTLTNTSSLITAAGDINIKAETVHNQGLQPQEITTLRRYWSFVNETGTAAALAAAFNARNNPTPSSSFASDLSAFIAWTGVMLSSSSKVVDGDQSFAATIQAGGKVNLKADQTLDNSVIRSFYEYVGAGKTLTDTGVGNGYSTPIRINPQLPPELAQQQVNPLELPGFTLPTGGNGLFRLSGQGSTLAQAPTPAQIAGLPDAASLSRPHKYLIETNPALTNLKQFMSSDYLLSNLGYNPDESAKRLGDGFYEQKLIQQAMVARTGQRFIDGQDSNEKLFKHLMDNAIQSKQQLDLAVGVTLTSEQVAALTHDIVWLESHEVNGEQVLVPVLYLAQANNRLAPNGSLIAGKDVSLIAGKDLNNVGTLRAANDLSAVAGENLVNSGLVEAGNRQDLLAGDYLVNRAGGIIAGRDVTLTTTQGDVINDRTLTTHQSSSAAYVREQRRDFLDSAARIEAGNSLSIDAERDFDSNGSVLHSGGDTRIKAGRNVSLNAVEQVVSNDRGIGNLDQSKTQHGATLESGGDLSIEAGGNVTAIASQIDAKGDVSMTAKDNLTLASAANEQHWASKTGTTKSEEDRVHQQATTVTAGGDVTLKSGQDMTLISSKVKAGDEAYLVAGGELNLLAEQDSEHSLYDMKKKGGWGNLQTQRDEVTRTTHIGSEISAGGNLTLKSDGDQKYQVAKLESGKDLTLESGGAITFEAVKDLHQESHEKTNNNSFWVSSKGKGNTDETLRQTQMVAAGNIVIKAVDGLKIDVRQVNQQTVSQSIDAMVKADPQLAWLKEAEKRGDVDWRVVKEIHDSYKYSNSGLGPASQIIIAIVMAAVVGPMAMGAMGTATGGAVVAGTMSSGTAGMLVSGAGAIATGAATNATVSFINNGGNLGAVFKDVTSSDAMKGYVISGVTAGLTTGYFDKWVGGKTNVLTGKVDLQLNTWAGVGKFAASQTLQGGTSMLLSKALGQGGNASDVLKNALFNTLAAASFNAVGDYTLGVFDDGSLPKIAIHAMVGGLLSEATGGDFKTGALAAGASEALVVELGQLVKGDENLLVMSSQIVGVLAAASQKDADAQSIEKGRWVAQQAILYNNLNHAAAEKLLKEIKDCRAAGGCSESKLKSILGKYESLSAERSNAINACGTRACVDKILNSSIRMDDPVSQELLGLLRQTTYDTPGLLQGNPDLVSWQSPNPSGWGDTFALDKQQAFAKNLKEGWLTPQELADLDRWNDSTSWVDRSAGRKLEPKEKASILLELGTAAAMALMGGRGSVGGAAKGTSEAAIQIPGRVQSRINIANERTATTPLRENSNPVSAGFDHVLKGHFDVKVSNSRSVFTVSPNELKGILQSGTVVKSPVSAMPDGQFVRTVDVGRVIGTTTLKDGGVSTSVMKIFTDKAGNLITAFPVKAIN